jgi:oligopeptide/dipeptide ABC transporter ATP-binding protein
MTPALELRGLNKSFSLKAKGGLFPTYTEHRAVRDVNLVLPHNSILGLVGESGSGKTTTGMMAMRLVEPTSGQILVEGIDITTLGHVELKPFRRKMQVVFQDSYSALDPMMTLAQIVAEPLHIHNIGTSAEQRNAALQMLERVGLDYRYGGRYSHELSGGQRQRVAIARALILQPSVLVADEPTSALDVSVKAQIINLLLDLQKERGLSVLFISHDLSVVRALTDQVAVMCDGRIVERAATEAIFTTPRHPYTRALLEAIPVLNPRQRRTRNFLTREEINSRIPAIRAADLNGSFVANLQPQLVAAAPDHFVEAIVS